MKTIIIDSGHGGSDSGANGNGLKEKDITLQLGKYIKAYLDGNYQDIKVILTRSTDVFIELIDRSKISNNAKADFFMSIHINSSVNSTGAGFETFIYNKASQASKNFQKIIHETIVKEAPFFKDRGMNQANFSVLRNTIAPAILTESGFISNKNDSDVLKDQNKLKALAIAHSLGLAKALNLKLKPTTTNTSWKVGMTFDSKEKATAFYNNLQKEGYKDFSLYQDK